MALKQRGEYRIIGEQDECVAAYDSVFSAIVRAQRLCEFADKPISFLIERAPVVGSRLTLNRVERDKQGVVITRVFDRASAGASTGGGGSSSPPSSQHPSTVDRTTRAARRESEVATATTKRTAPRRKAQAPAPARVSVRDAAIGALKRARHPLTLKQIQERVYATKGVVLEGATPDATIAKVLSREHHSESGVIERVGPGEYALRKEAKR